MALSAAGGPIPRVSGGPWGDSHGSVILSNSESEGQVQACPPGPRVTQAVCKVDLDTTLRASLLFLASVH